MNIHCIPTCKTLSLSQFSHHGTKRPFITSPWSGPTFIYCVWKKSIKKKTAKKKMIIYRLSQHIIPSDWADWKQITWIYWPKVLFILNNFKTCRLSISHPKMTETLQKHACMYCKVHDKFLHTKVQTKSSQRSSWYYDSKLAHSVTILSLLILCSMQLNLIYYICDLLRKLFTNVAKAMVKKQLKSELPWTYM